MLTNIYYFASFSTLIVCFFIIAVAIVRLGLCQAKTRPRIKYTALIFLSLTAAFQPYISPYLPGAGTLALALSIAILMLDGVPPFKSYQDKNSFFDTQIFDPNQHGDEP